MVATETAIREEMGEIQESALVVDRTGPRPIVRQAKIVGLTSRNGRIYRPAALKEALQLYAGAQINDNHPKGAAVQARGYGERMGHVLPANLNFREGAGIFGDLSMNPKHALTEQFLNDAEFAPQNVALSHNVLGKVIREGAMGIVEAISRVISVDVVGTPGSTNTLFESFEDSEAMKTVKKSLRVLLTESLTALAPAYFAICEAAGIGLDGEFEVAEGATADAQLIAVVESLTIQTVRESAADKWDRLKRFDQLRTDIVAKKSPVQEAYKGAGSAAGGASSLPNTGDATAAAIAATLSPVLEGLARINSRLDGVDQRFAQSEKVSLAEQLCTKHGVKPTASILESLSKKTSSEAMELEILTTHSRAVRGPQLPVQESRGSGQQNSGSYTLPSDTKAFAGRILSSN